MSCSSGVSRSRTSPGGSDRLCYENLCLTSPLMRGNRGESKVVKRPGRNEPE